jgi:ribosomal protein S18 acetylase RimI-like enzyme
MEIRYRKAVPADRGRIDALFLEMLRSIYHTDQVQGYGEHDLDRFFDRGEDRNILAEEAGEVRAFLSIEVHREDPDYLYLDDLSVTEASRGRGLGTRLIRIAEDYARELSIPVLVLHVERENTGARRLYERLGFLPYGETDTRLRMIKKLEET